MWKNETGDDDMQYIRGYYGVTARIGGRIRYTGSASGRPMDGTIVGAHGMYLRAHMDLPPGIEPASPNEFLFHPTWEIQYLDIPEGD